MENRIDRWLQRNNISGLFRKMAEWETENVHYFFTKQFDGTLTKTENTWAEYLQSEYEHKKWY